MSPAKDLPEDGQEEAVLSGAPEDAGTDEVEETEAEAHAEADIEQPEASLEDD